MNSQLLQQARLIDPVNSIDQIADILITDGKIAAIAPQLKELPPETKVRDCRGMVLGPGLVDLYSCSGEPGHEERETLESFVAAAVAGGFTRLNVLPNTSPPLDHQASVTALAQQYQRITGASSPQLQIWGALTKSMAGQQMTELRELAEAGIVGFTDGQAIENLGLLQRLLEYLQPLNKPIALVAANSQLQRNGVMREGSFSLRCGLPGDPAISESAALAGIIELIAMVGTPVHIMRLSTARGVTLIAEAKEQGLPITASTTWLHLLLNTTAVGSYDTSLRLDPPLGNPEDQQALREGVKQGIIDAIAVDHIAYTYEEKKVAFAEAPPGTIGLQLVLPLLWHSLVKTGEWSACQLWRALSTNPLRILHQEVSGVEVGKRAELILFDPQLTWQVTAQNLSSLSHNTFWLGKEVSGSVSEVPPTLNP